MINKTIFTFFLLCCMCSSSLAQNFQMEYFQFEDFSFIDEMRHADFNGDGLPDFLLGASNFGKLQVGINMGIAAPEFNEITNLTSVENTVVVDIDNDGDFDIIGLRQFSGVFAFINDGNAVFESQDLGIGGYNSLAFADITGDGLLEMIVGNFNLAIYQINTTSLELTEIYSGDFGNGDIGAIALLDYDKDGDDDLVLSTESDGLFLLEQTTALVFESSLIYGDNYDVDVIDVVNLTDDGISDFVLYGADDLKGKVIVSDIDGQYMEENLSMDGINNTLSLVGDFNEDDVEEIVTFENTSFNDPAMYIKGYMNGLINLEVVQDHFACYGGGVVDVDNDGDEDFYFFQNDVGEPGIIFYLNEGTVVDSDGDGFSADEDCDDDNPNVNPDAVEIANNGVDEDCDGVDLVSSTFNLANTTIKLFPNPAVDFINIEFDGHLDFQLILYDLDGKVIKESFNSKLLRVDDISHGAYLLEIKDRKTGQKIVEKIVIGK